VKTPDPKLWDSARKVNAAKQVVGKENRDAAQREGKAKRSLYRTLSQGWGREGSREFWESSEEDLLHREKNRPQYGVPRPSQKDGERGTCGGRRTRGKVKGGGGFNSLRGHWVGWLMAFPRKGSVLRPNESRRERLYWEERDRVGGGLERGVGGELLRTAFASLQRVQQHHGKEGREDPVPHPNVSGGPKEGEKSKG